MYVCNVISNEAETKLLNIMKTLKIANCQIKSTINFSKKDYEEKNIPFEREIQPFESFITEIANTVNDNKGTIADAVEMAEQSFKSL